jgi:hypothetical protein
MSTSGGHFWFAAASHRADHDPLVYGTLAVIWMYPYLY